MDFFESWLPFCLLWCVCLVFQKAGRGGSYLWFFYAFSPQLFSFMPSSVCVGRRFHGTVPTLHLPPSLPSSPSFLLNLSFHPVQTVCRCCPPLPLRPSLTPAVMRLNSVSTRHAHAHTLYTHTPSRVPQHTHNHPLKKEHTILSHMH